MRTIGALLALALLAGCGAPDDFDYDTCGVRPRVRIPVAMRDNLPLVLGSIKGQPAVFVLDTGADQVVLTEAALAKFGLATDRNVVLASSGIGGQTRNFAGQIQDLMIGDLIVPDHQVRLLSAESGIAQTGVDGLFGVSVLSIFEVDLDLPHGAVTLFAGRLCPDTIAPSWAYSAVVVDASRSERGRFTVPITVNGREFNALLDTGSNVSLLSTRAALSLGITPQQLATGPRKLVNGTGPHQVPAVTLVFKSIAFAEQTFYDQPFLVTDLPEAKLDVIIGSDYLAHRHIWLSYARRRAYIERPAVP